MDQQPKKKNFLFPEIYDVKSAQDAANQGVSVCILMIIASWVFVLIFTAAGAAAPNYQLLIIWSVLYGLIAMMIAKMSRLAAIAGLLFYLVDRLVFIAPNSGGNSIIMLLFIFAFVNSIRGTFAYHRIRHDRQMQISQGEDCVEHVDD